MTNEVAKREAFDTFMALDFSKPQGLAAVFVRSGFFKDTEDMSQAVVKIIAGQELGLGPFSAMQSLDIIEGSLRIGSAQLAAWAKASLKYDYRIQENTDTVCRILWLQRADDGGWESLGESSWTDADRDRAGLKLKTRSGKPSVWAKFPKAMLFNRAISNGVATFCPDVVPTGARIYTEGDSFGDRDEGYQERMAIDAPVAPLEVETPADEPEEPDVPESDAGERSDEGLEEAKLITASQRKKVMALCGELGLADEDRHAMLQRSFNLSSLTELTRSKASDFIVYLTNLKGGN